MPSDVPAVQNAVRLLERIARDWPDPVRSGVLIEDLELNRSTGYNLLGTLQRAGWADNRGPRAGWSLGPRLLAMAQLSTDWIGQLVQEELDALSGRLGFLAFAVQRRDSGTYAVRAKSARGRAVRTSVGVGDDFVFSAPAIMRAFHAWSDLREFDRLADRHGVRAFTPETVVDRRRLHQVLRRVRERGYGASLQEYHPGQSGVAAPVFDLRGRVSMVVCSLAVASELDESTVESVGESVRECGARITERTGGCPPEH